MKCLYMVVSCTALQGRAAGVFIETAGLNDVVVIGYGSV